MTKENNKIVTPIKVEKLAIWLDGYEKKDYILDGFTNGFRVGYTGHPASIVYKNHKSATQQPETIKDYIAKEIEAGRIIGPLNSLPSNFHCAPIGVVPKKEKDEYRVIHDLSYPEGQSINDFIPPEHTAVSYQSVYDAVKMLVEVGDGAYMSKTDIQKAFRIIPIHPDDQHLFCMVWEDQCYMDLAMQMGCSSACQIFQAFSDAIKWIAEYKLKIPNVNYLDDFMLGSKTRKLGDSNLKIFLQMCDDIGVPISEKKTFGPETKMTFLGIEIDTIKRQVRLPLEKVQRCVTEIEDLISRKKARLKKLQSIIGLLNFACQVVLPGRAFLRRLINLTIGYKALHHWIQIKPAVEDLKVWLHFLKNHNGKIFFVDEQYISNHEVDLYTDSSGSLGFGALFGKCWFSGTWSQWWLNQNITTLELYPIVLALEIWGHLLTNKRLRLFTDNIALVYILTKQTAKEEAVMILMRRLVFTCLKNNIVLEAKHVLGRNNLLCDLLSRRQVEKFFQLFPGANKMPEAIPELPPCLI